MSRLTQTQHYNMKTCLDVVDETSAQSRVSVVELVPQGFRRTLLDQTDRVGVWVCCNGGNVSCECLEHRKSGMARLRRAVVGVRWCVEVWGAAAKQSGGNLCKWMYDDVIDMQMSIWRLWSKVTSDLWTGHRAIGVFLKKNFCLCENKNSKRAN